MNKIEPGLELDELSSPEDLKKTKPTIEEILNNAMENIKSSLDNDNFLKKIGHEVINKNNLRTVLLEDI
jgi:hypothetical protein